MTYALYKETHLLIEIAECVGDCCAGPEER